MYIICQKTWCSYRDKYDIAMPFKELGELKREELTSEKSGKCFGKASLSASALGGEEQSYYMQL